MDRGHVLLSKPRWQTAATWGLRKSVQEAGMPAGKQPLQQQKPGQSTVQKREAGAQRLLFPLAILLSSQPKGGVARGRKIGHPCDICCPVPFTVKTETTVLLFFLPEMKR